MSLHVQAQSEYNELPAYAAFATILFLLTEVSCNITLKYTIFYKLIMNFIIKVYIHYTLIDIFHLPKWSCKHSLLQILRQNFLFRFSTDSFMRHIIQLSSEYLFNLRQTPVYPLQEFVSVLLESLIT